MLLTQPFPCWVQYLSYDLSTPSRRRMLLGMGRNLLQQEKSGVQLKIAVLTNTARWVGQCGSGGY